ncbi:MAG: hypothetical protein SGI77_00860 [Pirellulaceae bacterium]|nr:hypothetical protein [Pirellulaceae bacterium]
MRRRSSKSPSLVAIATGTLACSLALDAANGQGLDSLSHPPNFGSYPAYRESSPRNTQSGDPSYADAIYWSKREFTIPFHVDPSGKQPAEVQLEISTDNGASWSLYARDSLQSRQFRFASTEDGVYLFRIKTIDDAGLAYDPGGQPLKVLVDTRSPELGLSVDTDPQGRLVADFTLVESNPRLDSLRLEYQTEQSNRWTAIPFETTQTSNDEIKGRGVWEIPASARQLVVRLIAIDAAGNESEVTRLPLLPKTAQGMGGLQFASGAATPRFGQDYTVNNSAPGNNPPSNPKPNPTPTLATKPLPPAAATFGQPYSAGAPAQPQSSTQSLPLPSTSVVSSTSQYPLQPLDSESRSSNFDPDLGGALVLDGAAIPSQSSDRKSRSGQPTQAIDTDRTEPPLGTAQAITDKPYYSSSRAFSLDYELDSQAASPVASIELWGTTDGGRIWERWGTDPDGVSPFDIKVETEGLFGFRMVIVGANGLAGNRPQNGDNADAWIQVDTERPSARIQSALYGKGTDANSLVVDFKAEDAYFGERPVSLMYSELPTGPWTTIANGMRNTGRYVWPSDPTLPRRVYLKLEAHDEAGNIGEHRLDVPVDIEGLAPRGRIQGFRPITGN